MNTSPPQALVIARRSSGLTPAHIVLIQMLAEIAVEQYIDEIEGGDAAERTLPDRATRSEERS